MLNAVVTKDLEVHHGDVLALSGVTIEIPVGKSLAVIGANGSGKSTLLGALAGLNKPTIGTAETIERPALVLQATEVDDGLPITVLDAVKLGRYPSLGLFRRFSDADKQAVDEAMARMNITDLADTRLHRLSGGQRQRVLIAQGLAQRSRVLLLDEPMTGLDIAAFQTVLDVMNEELAADRTVLMTTHSLADARACDLVLMLATEPIAFGTPDEALTEANLLRMFDHAVVQVGDQLLIGDHHVH